MAFPVKRPGLALIHTVVAVALPAIQLPDAGIGADRMKSLVMPGRLPLLAVKPDRTRPAVAEP